MSMAKKACQHKLLFMLLLVATPAFSMELPGSESTPSRVANHEYTSPPRTRPVQEMHSPPRLRAGGFTSNHIPREENVPTENAVQPNQPHAPDSPSTPPRSPVATHRQDWFPDTPAAPFSNYRSRIQKDRMTKTSANAELSPYIFVSELGKKLKLTGRIIPHTPPKALKSRPPETVPEHRFEKYLSVHDQRRDLEITDRGTMKHLLDASPLSGIYERQEELYNGMPVFKKLAGNAIIYHESNPADSDPTAGLWIMAEGETPETSSPIYKARSFYRQRNAYSTGRMWIPANGSRDGYYANTQNSLWTVPDTKGVWSRYPGRDKKWVAFTAGAAEEVQDGVTRPIIHGVTREVSVKAIDEARIQSDIRWRIESLETQLRNLHRDNNERVYLDDRLITVNDERNMTPRLAIKNSAHPQDVQANYRKIRVLRKESDALRVLLDEFESEDLTTGFSKLNMNSASFEERSLGTPLSPTPALPALPDILSPAGALALSPGSCDSPRPIRQPQSRKAHHIGSPTNSDLENTPPRKPYLEALIDSPFDRKVDSANPMAHNLRSPLEDKTNNIRLIVGEGVAQRLEF